MLIKGIHNVWKIPHLDYYRDGLYVNNIYNLVISFVRINTLYDLDFHYYHIVHVTSYHLIVIKTFI